jgi:hypothetical protein
MSNSSLEMDRERMQYLLALLDARLERRGVSASVYVVGGAAIALSIRDDRRTQDIDVIASDAAVLEEAGAIAEAEHLSPNWLNQAARPWIPDHAETSPPEIPGLKVSFAPPDHLMAMKLVAMRRQDLRDITILAFRIGMLEASAEDYADLLERVYGTKDSLQQVLGVPYEQVRAEAVARGAIAVRALQSARFA